MKNITQQSKFFQGLALGLVITSAISYAAVSLQTFTAGSPISAAQMNANFDAIKLKLNSLDIGYVGSMNVDQTITCGAGGVYAYTVVNLTDDYNDGHYSSAIYTIPETGIYKIFLNAQSEDSMGYLTNLEISVDGGINWTSAYINYYETQIVKKFTEGDRVRLVAGCSAGSGMMSGAGTDSTIDHSNLSTQLKNFRII